MLEHVREHVREQVLQQVLEKMLEQALQHVLEQVRGLQRVLEPVLEQVLEQAKAEEPPKEVIASTSHSPVLRGFGAVQRAHPLASKRYWYSQESARRRLRRGPPALVKDDYPCPKSQEKHDKAHPATGTNLLGVQGASRPSPEVLTKGHPGASKVPHN